MNLLNFVATFALLLMPMGAVIFVDFWLFEKIRLIPNFAEHRKLRFNWAAGLAWFITVAICLWLVLTGRIEIYFVSLPGWFFTASLYLLLSIVYQKKLNVTPERQTA